MSWVLIILVVFLVVGTVIAKVARGRRTRIDDAAVKRGVEGVAGRAYNDLRAQQPDHGFGPGSGGGQD